MNSKEKKRRKKRYSKNIFRFTGSLVISLSSCDKQIISQVVKTPDSSRDILNNASDS